MKIPKSLATIFLASLFLLSVSVKAKADDWDKKTIFTFSGPVEVAGHELAAGTYVFKLADTPDRHVVRICNADETHVIATVLANADYRLTPTGKTVIKFSERNNASESSGNVPAGGVPIKEWFYAGDLAGSEFRVKPMKQIAEAQPEANVATTITAPSEEVAENEAAPEPAPEAAPSTEVKPNEEVAPTEEEQGVQEAPGVPAPTAVAPTVEQKTEPTELPQTGSDLPLIGLIGVITLVAAASLRVFLKISA